VLLLLWLPQYLYLPNCKPHACPLAMMMTPSGITEQDLAKVVLQYGKVPKTKKWCKVW
jgi:hypothetical protein